MELLRDCVRLLQKGEERYCLRTTTLRAKHGPISHLQQHGSGEEFILERSKAVITPFGEGFHNELELAG